MVTHDSTRSIGIPQPQPGTAYRLLCPFSPRFCTRTTVKPRNKLIEMMDVHVNDDNQKKCAVTPIAVQRVGGDTVTCDVIRDINCAIKSATHKFMTHIPCKFRSSL